MAKFKTYGYTFKGKGTKFNTKASFVMKGKKIIIQDYINENSDGMNFYENLERLGSVENTIAYMKRNGEELYGDFTNSINLENAEKQRIAQQNIWDRLPAEIRDKQFGNSFENFRLNGGKYFETIKQNYIKEKINEQIVKDTANKQVQNTKNTTNQTQGNNAN